MAGSAEVAKRRQTVGELWLRGVPTLRIAKQLNISYRTARDDVASVRQQLQDERVEELEQRRDRTIAVLRTVQREAWTLFGQVEAKSMNKSGALNTVLSAEQTIAKLEGTLGADIKVDSTTNVTITEDWQRIQSVILEALSAHPEAKVSVAEALMKLDHAQLN